MRPSEGRSSAIGAALVLGGCGASAIGEECGTIASESACEDDAVCSERDACPPGEPDCGVVGRCRLICLDDTDCPGGGSCEDVRDSSFESCIPTR